MTVLDRYYDGNTVTCTASAAITGGRLVKITGNRQAGALVPVATVAAGNVVFGVAGIDAAVGDDVPIVRVGVVGLTAAAAITAGQLVEAAADGKVAPKATGAAIGVALEDIAIGATGPVALNI